jgi:hypothetical protein
MTNQKKLRRIEHCGLQPTFDRLHADSQKGKVFTKLMEIISSEENIRPACRNIKKNGGSTTAGADGVQSRILKNAYRKICPSCAKKAAVLPTKTS